jgi:hypothetical protein
MAKTRLNNDDRAAIAVAIVDYKYAPLIALNRALEYELASLVYDRIYSADVRRKMAALPAGAFKEVDDITVAVNGQKYKLDFSADNYDVLGSNPAGRDDDRLLKPVLYKHADRSYSSLPALLLTDEDSLGARIVAWSQEREELRQAPATARSKLDAALASYRYFDDLVTSFPEAERFILTRWRERPEGGSPGVPAVVLKDLARELDLPPEAEAA